MKKQLLKKLSAFIVTAMLFSASANAQIVYTDVNPDTTFNSPSGSYLLDVNNDGITDNWIRTRNFIARCSSRGTGTYSLVNVSTYNNSGISNCGVVSNASGDQIIPLNFSDLISSAQPFTNYSLDLRRILSGSTCNSASGNWPNLSEKYLGLKFTFGVNTYYGWVRMQIDVTSSSASCTIKDYAYNSIPNQPIRAGETSCAIPTVTIAKSGSLSFCAGDSVILTANGTGYQYQWKRNGVNINGANLKTYVAKSADTYKCKVTNSCGSIISSAKKVTVTCRPSNKVVAEQVESPYELKIAPNPISSSTTVSFSINHAEKVSIKVVDINGRLITTLANHLFKEGVHSIVWKAENVRSGIYLLQIRTAEYSRTEKLIVTK